MTLFTSGAATGVPIYMGGGSTQHYANVVRQMVNALSDGHIGVIPSPSQDALKVTNSGTTVTVATGVAIVSGVVLSGLARSSYTAAVTGTASYTMSLPGAGTRYDRVYLAISDNDYSEGNNRYELHYNTGGATSGSATAPTTPHIVLAEVVSNSSAIQSITDLRAFHNVNAFPLRVASANAFGTGKRLPNPSMGDMVYRTDNNTVEVWSGTTWDVFKQVNGASVEANGAVSQTFNANVWTTVKFSSEQRDTHSAYDLSTGIFTAPRSGIYGLSFSCGVDRDDTFLMRMLIKYNTSSTFDGPRWNPSYASSNETPIHNMAGFFYCAAGNTIYPQVSISSTVTRSVGYDLSITWIQDVS